MSERGATRPFATTEEDWGAFRGARTSQRLAAADGPNLRSCTTCAAERSAAGTRGEERAVEIQGKKAVIVGGASGMARPRRSCCSREGRASIAILDLPTSEGAEVAKGLGGTFHPVDVTDDDNVEQALADAVEALGGLHIAVNTAGGGIGDAHAHEGRPAPARRVPAGDRAQPDRHVQPQPAAGLAHVDRTSPKTASAA